MRNINEPYRLALSKPLTEDQDRRRKLPTSEHAYIRERSKQGESQRQLARAYGVSRRLIVFILYPERLKALQIKKSVEKYSQKYYHSKMKGQKWAKTMREHRHYKLSLNR